MFSHYIGIDYSGKGLPSQRHTAIQVFEASAGPMPVRAQDKSSWSRQGVYRYLAERLEAQRAGSLEPMIVGMDHGLSFPLSYFREASPSKPEFHSWISFLAHFHDMWQGVKTESVSSVQAPTLPYANPTELRLTEKFTPAAKSVLNLNPTLISVAFSTHAGLPWIYELRNEYADVLHVWPYDGLVPEAGMSVIAEVYPSMLHHRFDYPPELTKRDEKDAYAIAKWLQEQDNGGTLRHYMSLVTLDRGRLAAVVPLEGWILGVL
ncbi:hypothetical protein GZH47_27525 [Paenibacillus rhizovicinus]|uniref:DUF429 domain-containing protein n=1 Tax=Paenibacillus rhizovicinus TaxID=2704463 RepID=A0A6C0P742_9BACL|nr:hypothetical protein [Paenibacillus rhizovicinus]QHW34176.1 hypothetical protein GZH47_27525 [Paenibacillus rhizovicinus]